MKPLRLRDTALAALLRCLLQLRCCTPLPLCNTLFQRLALLSDTSLVQSAFGRAFSFRSPLRARELLSSPSFPLGGALASFAFRQSGFHANGTRRLTFFASPSTADNGTAVRAMIGRVRNRILCQLPDLYASATPHSLRSTVSAPSPVIEPLPLCHKLLPASRSETDLCSNCLVLPSARYVLRTSIADNNTSIGCIDYSRCAVRRGTNSISPMTAAATLLSSFVRAVLTWRHRTVTSNCKQPEDTSSAVSPLIA